MPGAVRLGEVLQGLKAFFLSAVRPGPKPRPPKRKPCMSDLKPGCRSQGPIPKEHSGRWRSAVDEAAALLKLREPGRRGERVDPAEVEFFEAGKRSKGGGEVGEGIGAEIEKAKFSQAADGVGERGEPVAAEMEFAKTRKIRDGVGEGS